MKKKPTKKPVKKTKSQKQHDVRGASFLRIAKDIKELGGGYVYKGSQLYCVVKALENEGKRARKLR